MERRRRERSRWNSAAFRAATIRSGARSLTTPGTRAPPCTSRSSCSRERTAASKQGPDAKLFQRNSPHELNSDATPAFMWDPSDFTLQELRFDKRLERLERLFAHGRLDATWAP